MAGRLTGRHYWNLHEGRHCRVRHLWQPLWRPAHQIVGRSIRPDYGQLTLSFFGQVNKDAGTPSPKMHHWPRHGVRLLFIEMETHAAGFGKVCWSRSATPKRVTGVANIA